MLINPYHATFPGKVLPKGALSKICFWSAFLVVILTSPFFLCIPIPKFMGICTVCDRHLCASTRYKIQEIHKLGKNMRGVMLVFCRFFPKPNSFARFIDFDKLHEGLELWMEHTGSVPGKLSPGALQNHVPYNNRLQYHTKKIMISFHA